MSKRRSNGEGSVYAEGDHFVAKYWYRGERKTTRIRGVTTKTEARAVLNKILAEIAEETYVETNNLTIEVILKEIMEEREKRGKLSDSTILSNEHTAKIIFNMKIAKKNIQKVDYKEINECLYELTPIYSDSYIDKIYRQLVNVYRRAKDTDKIKKNWFDLNLIEKPKSQKERRKVEALTVEDHKKFMKELDKGYDKYTVILYILIETGMRVRRSISLRQK